MVALQALLQAGAPRQLALHGTRAHWMQPFACVPNHVTGKGMIKEIRRLYPGAKIVAVDYDPGASEVNQLNRIRLMLTNAFSKMTNSRPAQVPVLQDDRHESAVRDN